MTDSNQFYSIYDMINKACLGNNDLGEILCKVVFLFLFPLTRLVETKLKYVLHMYCSSIPIGLMFFLIAKLNFKHCNQLIKGLDS